MMRQLSRIRRRLFDWVLKLHSDESGVISLLTVFLMLGCTWLLLWVLNTARELDSKVRLQVAADACGQSAVGILARGMNAIAFANQLEAELFAAVAVMEASQSTAAASSPLLALRPVFETILSGNGTLHLARPISAFRRDVVHKFPLLASELAQTTGRLHGAWRGPDAATNPDGPQGLLLAQMWSTAGSPLGQGVQADPRSRTLPVFDPSPQGLDSIYLSDAATILEAARLERLQLATRYLRPWALDLAAGDETLADLIIARAGRPLSRLLNVVYRDTNLPYRLRNPHPNLQSEESDLMFVSTVYRNPIRPTAPRMFSNPNSRHAPAMALAQVHLFLPRSRLTCCPWTEVRIDPRTGQEYTVYFTDGWPGEWSASTQNWQAKLVPVTAKAAAQIIATSPNGGTGPAWGMLTPRQFDELVHH